MQSNSLDRLIHGETAHVHARWWSVSVSIFAALSCSKACTSLLEPSRQPTTAALECDPVADSSSTDGCVSSSNLSMRLLHIDRHVPAYDLNMLLSFPKIPFFPAAGAPVAACSSFCGATASSSSSMSLLSSFCTSFTERSLCLIWPDSASRVRTIGNFCITSSKSVRDS